MKKPEIIEIEYRLKPNSQQVSYASFNNWDDALRFAKRKERAGYKCTPSSKVIQKAQ